MSAPRAAPPTPPAPASESMMRLVSNAAATGSAPAATATAAKPATCHGPEVSPSLIARAVAIQVLTICLSVPLGRDDGDHRGRRGKRWRVGRGIDNPVAVDDQRDRRQPDA